MCMSSFQAGVETTAITIGSFIYNVVIHRECQGKIHAEIDAAKKAGKLSSPPQLRELKAHLPYTSACLSESLRLHPVIGMPLMRVVPEGGAQLEGYSLPAGVCESSLFGAASWLEIFRLSLGSILGYLVETKACSVKMQKRGDQKGGSSTPLSTLDISRLTTCFGVEEVDPVQESVRAISP